MSAPSNDRILRNAIAGSLSVHLIVAAVICSRPVTAAPEQRALNMRVVQLIRPKPTPPPPKPALPHPQRQSHAVRPAMHRVHIAVVPHVDGPPIAQPPVEPTGEPYPVDSASPDVAPTAAPIVATPTPKAACSSPDVPAKTLVAESPIITDDERNGFNGTAKVKVDLDAAGKVVGTSIYESTGSVPLDQAALAAARESRYAPEERDCKDVPGSYLFAIDFQ
jgi:TonB family protein